MRRTLSDDTPASWAGASAAAHSVVVDTGCIHPVDSLCNSDNRCDFPRIPSTCAALLRLEVVLRILTVRRSNSRTLHTRRYVGEGSIHPRYSRPGQPRQRIRRALLMK